MSSKMLGWLEIVQLLRCFQFNIRYNNIAIVNFISPKGAIMHSEQSDENIISVSVSLYRKSDERSFRPQKEHFI